ncbi:MAG: ATP-dependent 6-phosphofructokinase [Chloroflexi bacterium]|nr:ATP-dependent 6-phosphofructokinase [Chloroflexota bacterium]
MSKKRRIGILTGGGDVPGLNVAMKAVVNRARDHEVEIVGLRRGWWSVVGIKPENSETIQELTIPLSPERVRTIDRTGGTFLHSSRTNPSNMKAEEIPDFVAKGDRRVKDDGRIDVTSHVLKVLETLQLDALIPIGGDDTLNYATRLHEEGFQIVAIPKTMDNDVFGTDYCIGFSTAVTRSVENITAVRTVCGSHERVGVVELFGRNSGETSLFAAYLADVDRAIISEVPFDLDKLIAFLKADRAKNPSNYAIMTISEGAHLQGGQIVQSGEADDYGHQKLGGIGQIVAQEIKDRSGMHTVYQQLGYLMRSGSPDSLDRMVAVSFGNLALDQVLLGHTGRMVALQQGNYTTVPLPLVISAKKTVDVNALYDPENYKPRVKDMLGKPMFLY